MPRQFCVRCNECFEADKHYRCMDCVNVIKRELSDAKEKLQPMSLELKETKLKFETLLKAILKLKTSNETVKNFIDSCTPQEAMMASQHVLYLLKKGLDRLFQEVSSIERKNNDE